MSTPSKSRVGLEGTQKQSYLNICLFLSDHRNNRESDVFTVGSTMTLEIFLCSISLDLQRMSR